MTIKMNKHDHLSCFGNTYRNWFNMRRAIYAVLLTYAISVCFCSVAYLTFAVRERAEIEDESTFGTGFIGPGMPDERDPHLDEDLINLNDSKALERLIMFRKSYNRSGGYEYYDKLETNAKMTDKADLAVNLEPYRLANETKSNLTAQIGQRRDSGQYRVLQLNSSNWNISDAQLNEIFDYVGRKKTYVVSSIN